MSLTLPFLIVLGVALGCSNTSRNSTTLNSASPAATPSATPVQTFAELKREADNLLAIKEDGYYLADETHFGRIASQLLEVPKDSKDGKAARALHEKVVKKLNAVNTEKATLGEKPKNSEWDGSVEPVKEYLRATLNDYSSSEFVEWSPVIMMREKN